MPGFQEYHAQPGRPGKGFRGFRVSVQGLGFRVRV